ncbi:MAG: purine-binding chemotaxis protein CheW [Clostridia bacterium]|jgi:purine-binding chemotaxis protein CheW|nr:purine-binding chemotaxis protein CheW [Clostridia bacterium]
MDNFITFSINDQVMGLEMLSVERILKLLNISPIPNSPEYLEGVIDVQNMLIPAINLKKRFNYTSSAVLPDSHVIVISNENERCSIIVDAVDDIVQISDHEIVKTKSNRYIYGVAKINDTIINLLNPNALVFD